ncbi:putative receptor-like cytosolic serine/threonine-protein kinase RBK2-like [Capsicum annuum]|nr:putative receptor-like cytosolic serine/threonine-protein kinase RBK2-like [Capsicum annuum]
MPTEFDLPEEVQQVLPSDPFEQLDLARKITSIALSTRISALESEAASLRRLLSERDDIISDLNSQLDSLDSSLSDASDRISRAEQEKVRLDPTRPILASAFVLPWTSSGLTCWILQESLVKENATLSNTVKKLNRDVAKYHALGRDSEWWPRPKRGASRDQRGSIHVWGAARWAVTRSGGLCADSGGLDPRWVPAVGLSCLVYNITGALATTPSHGSTRGSILVSHDYAQLVTTGTPPVSRPPLLAHKPPLRVTAQRAAPHMWIDPRWSRLAPLLGPSQTGEPNPKD